jgi:hypothetical protein
MKTFLLVTFAVLVPVLLSGQPRSSVASGHTAKDPSKEQRWFNAATCNGSVAETKWTLVADKSPNPACITGKDVEKGVLDFDANEDQSAILPFTLPPHFAGNIHVTIMWQPASAIGSVGWCVELIPAGALKREGGGPISQTARNCASEEAKKSAHHLERELVINLVAEAPARGNDVWHIRLSRDANSSVVLDDMPGDARLVRVGIETHEAARGAL